jgi:diguanylate cyclase (GGDEF)-like protein
LRAALSDNRRFVQLIVVGVSVILLLITLHRLRETTSFELVTVFVCVLLSRAVPVAVAREKQITFTPSLVFASAVLVNGPAAGLAILAAYLLESQFHRRRPIIEHLYHGGQFTLAALAAEQAYLGLNGRPAVLSVFVSALVFSVANGVLAGVGKLASGQAPRPFLQALSSAEAMTYGVGMTLAATIVAGFGSSRQAALIVLAGALVVCAQTIRATVENRILRRQLWSVEKLGRACANEVRTEAPLRQFLGLARELVAFDRAVLWLIDDQTANLRPSVAYPDATELPAETDAGPETILGRVAERTEPLITTSTWADPYLEDRSEAESWLLYPLTLQGRPLGVAQFVRSGRAPFSRTESDRLAALVPQATVAFETVRIRHEMFRYRDKSVTDSLTGLLNNLASKKQLEMEVGRAQRYFRSVSILMLDVDSFKEFNDTYGHPQGDQLLVMLARILRSSVRTVDHVGRYGGEEFIIILPETGRSDAQILAERIRAAVAAQWFRVGEGQEARTTVSIGVAGYPDDAMDAEQLLQHADDALYRAKRSGRNRVLTA